MVRYGLRTACLRELLSEVIPILCARSNLTVCSTGPSIPKSAGDVELAAKKFPLAQSDKTTDFRETRMVDGKCCLPEPRIFVLGLTWININDTRPQ